MRILKSHSLLKLVNNYVIDSPQPSNISYLWKFSSLLIICLIIQIITGVTLGMHYTPNVLEAFDSVEHIMRDINNEWLIRYLHSNTASAFFLLVYLHMGRGLYYGSYKAIKTGFINHNWDFRSVLGIVMIIWFIILVLETNTNIHEIIINTYHYLITTVHFIFENFISPSSCFIFKLCQDIITIMIPVIKFIWFIIWIVIYFYICVKYSPLIWVFIYNFIYNSIYYNIYIAKDRYKWLWNVIYFIFSIMFNRSHAAYVISWAANRSSYLFIGYMIIFLVLPDSEFITTGIKTFPDLEFSSFFNENYFISMSSTNVDMADNLYTNYPVSIAGYDDDFSILMANSNADSTGNMGGDNPGLSGGDNPGPSDGDNNQHNSVGTKRKREEDSDQLDEVRQAPNPFTSSIGGDSPSVEVLYPSVEEGSPSVVESSPSVAEGSPSVAELSPSVAEGSPSVAEGSPSVAEGSPSVAEGSPNVSISSDLSSEGSTNPDSASSNDSMTGQFVIEATDPCPCCLHRPCDCSGEGGCIPNGICTANSCCNCQTPARYIPGLDPDGRRATDVTNCEWCDCGRCPACWRNVTEAREAGLYNLNNDSNNSSNNSDKSDNNSNNSDNN